MTLQELEADLAFHIQDKSLLDKFKGWINNAILELAGDLEFPPLRTVQATPFPVTSDTWLFNAPDDFHKRIFRAADSNYAHIRVDHQRKPLDFSYLDRANLAHDVIQDHVRMVAAGDDNGVLKIGVYPKATETIYLWYYRKPPVLAKPGDSPSFIPTEFHARVIIPKVIIRSYQKIIDMVEGGSLQPLQYWQGELAKEQTNLKFYLAKLYNPPRRHGGRDSIGPGRYYGGFY
jgi:hypothetical protein